MVIWVLVLSQLVIPRARAWNLELLDLQLLAPLCLVPTIQIGIEQDLELDSSSLLFFHSSVKLGVLWPHSLFLDCVRCLNPEASVPGIVLGNPAHRSSSKTQPWS